MDRISSKSTFYYKWVFPAVWFGFLAVMTVGVIRSQFASGEFSPLVLLFPVMAAFGYFIMRALIFDLVDEVWDDGDSLVVRNRGTEDRIALTNIKNVNYAMTSPPRVTLSLRQPNAFGPTVTFCPPFQFNPVARSPIIDGLIDRIDAKRKR